MSEKKQTEIVLSNAEKYLVEKMEYDVDQLSIVKKHIAPGISDAELHHCLSVARAYDLNPIMKQIWIIKRGGYVGSGNDKQWVEKYEPMVGRDGCRVIARRKGMVTPPVCKVELKEVPVLQSDGKTFKMEQDLVATATLKIKNEAGEIEEHSREAWFHNYAQRTKQGDITKFWRDNPAGQLMKVAEVNLLKAIYGIDVDSFEGGFVDTRDSIDKGDIIDASDFTME